ncbi:MAG: ATP-binding protein, partial [Myxococcota bacterium]
MSGVGHIWLRSFADSVFVTLQVQDEGAGLEPSVREKMFKLFFTTKEQGTGLGLSILQDLMDVIHGSIDVETELGQGTTFTLRFPIVPVLEMAAPPFPSDSEGLDPGGSIEGHPSGTVLIVDDNAVVRH